MGRQQDFIADHAALFSVVAVLAVVFAVELFTGSVGRGCDGGLSCTALDLRGVEME